jgi:hypothetical protein
MNYPEGSMKGSGIDSYDFEDERTCTAELEADIFCDFEGQVTVWVNDWGTELWDCPKCGHENQED